MYVFSVCNDHDKERIMFANDNVPVDDNFVEQLVTTFTVWVIDTQISKKEISFCYGSPHPLLHLNTWLDPQLVFY